MNQENIEKEGVVGEKVAEQESSLSYNDYLEKGGQLSESDYELAKSAMESDSFEVKMSSSSTTQAENMAKSAGIIIDNKLIKIYCALREQTFTPENNDEPKKDTGTSPGLSDQKLLAETLRLMDRTDDLELFMGYYSNIFPKVNKKEEEENMRAAA
jgi:hypothetical protein